MARLPDTARVPVIRADFSDDAVWARPQEDISEETEEGFVAEVEFVEDRTLVCLDVPALVRAFPAAAAVQPSAACRRPVPRRRPSWCGGHPYGHP
ncbi:DUF6924 domain-containing protein [Micromonospora sp. CPCC 205556]|uniref:DUF6924 domain-containing protein n=1 Tax=Micromonospora sp. CPCC 205556 TaxID=3122398 RepID=UPI002FF436A8